jgi:hypothetical protein
VTPDLGRVQCWTTNIKYLRFWFFYKHSVMPLNAIRSNNCSKIFYSFSHPQMKVSYITPTESALGLANSYWWLKFVHLYIWLRLKISSNFHYTFSNFVTNHCINHIVACWCLDSLHSMTHIY